MTRLRTILVIIVWLVLIYLAITLIIRVAERLSRREYEWHELISARIEQQI